MRVSIGPEMQDGERAIYADTRSTTTKYRLKSMPSHLLKTISNNNKTTASQLF